MKTELNRPAVSAAGSTFALIVSRWHDDLTGKLANGAIEALSERGADEGDIDIFHVPGAFEVPLACCKAAETGSYDAVIGIGVVIRGDTPHFDYVAGEAARGIMDASLRSGVPVMFGVLTVETLEQAEARCVDGPANKGYEAGLSAIEAADTMRAIRSHAEARLEDF